MRARPSITVVCAAALVFLGGCATTSDPDTASVPASVTEGKKDMPPPVAAIADDPAAPVSLTLDGVTAPTDPVATDASGTLLPPQDVSRLGWWVDSAMPGGGSGAIVVTGHVDDVDQGDGFAARFADVREGDELTVSTGDGRAREYRVDRLLSVGKEGNLPLDEINRLDGPETLLLVTCGGEFVGPPLGYANNDFVFAVPTGPAAEVPAP